MSDVTLKIVLDDAHLDKSEAVGRALEAAGLHIEESIPEIGVIFGTADESKLKAVQRTEGVLEVSPEGTFQLPPMSDEIPQ